VVALHEVPPPPVDDEGFTRTPPHDVDAEMSVLGACLISRDAVLDLTEAGLTGKDFYLPKHETIWNVLADLYGRDQPTDGVAVAAALKERGELAGIGGPIYLHTVESSTPSAANATHYAQIVRGLASRRRLITAGTRIVQLGYAADGGSTEDIENAAQAEVYAATSADEATDYVPAGDLIAETFDAIDAASKRGAGMTGIPTGFMDLDKLTDGFQPGQFVIVAGRPAAGKSTLGLDVARSAAIHHQIPSVIFSLEMSRQEIMMRLLSAEARVPLQKIRKGDLDELDWARLAKMQGNVEAAPLFIDDSANMTLPQIRAKCRRLKQRHGLKLVVVDYLQLMTSGRKVESRQQEVSEFSRALKLLAKELEIPVIGVCQLNRGPEQRSDKKPLLSDLRESGSLEQDADIVILLHREDLYEKESPRAGEADFIVAKHRNGPTDTITVASQLHYSRFVDLAS
jgi:replicative DNA helicase